MSRMLADVWPASIAYTSDKKNEMRTGIQWKCNILWHECQYSFQVFVCRSFEMKTKIDAQLTAQKEK